ncbi:MAG TPA: zinc-dependent metalloprotease [Gemmatimonadales bacterium]|nr:zinc-dependent metalloprotease [Gemmatimonadales bacterium]
MDFIDWRVAQRVGELIAGTPPFGEISASRVEPLARDFAARVSSYSGLRVPTELPPLELVDRPAWIAANLRTMRPLLGRLTERMGAESKGLLAGPARSASGLFMGAQVGALTGMLSQRVLGQYDLALLDSTVPPRLLLLAPNLAQAARSLQLDRDELVLWVTIHEITHAVQFSGAPWLREHLGAMITELIDGLHVALAPQEKRSRAPRLPDASALFELVERARRGELLRLTLGEDRWRLIERMQAVMSLIEGHAEHTMDVVGAELLPSLGRLRAAMDHRRENRGLPWRVLERLLGLELKLRQYRTGRRFCDAVVADGGPEALARAWTGPDSLPTPQELERPETWLARVGAAPPALPATSGG